MDVHIEPSWKAILAEEFEKSYFETLVEFVKDAYRTQQVYPPAKEIFNAFSFCPFDRVRVVILGQDPYHGPGQAHGLCFSVNEGVRMPPSLVNIFKEIQDDIGTPFPKDGNLSRWAKQGVLLLNATLTVTANQPGSHQKKGWETFTDAVIQKVSNQKEQVVFMLWGAYARQKQALIDPFQHLVLTSAHPSPFSVYRGFFGNKHFSKANRYLEAHGKEGIVW
ncbi:MAG: uracil-DNA glycosylase [Bacteroidota bacterium]